MEAYLNNRNDCMPKLVKKHYQNKRIYYTTSDAKRYLNEINLSTDNISENSLSTKKVKQIKTGKN